jgi:alkanesulfonate monooxygenase SsuD/methylene tetrahydromethanopterin reductase-like flavin-dependent oxidoreductase (luciferase family)
MPDTALALSLPIQGVSTPDGIDLVRRAADWGYEACWLSEVQGPDAFTQLGALAVSTDLELGVAVVPVQTRTTFVLGMTAVSLAELTGGRFHLGIGASSEVIVTRWAGAAFESPLRRVRETVEALRPMLRGERTSYEGRFVTVDGYRPHATPAEPVPLWVGALNPRSLRQAGEIGDGVCLNQFGPEHLPGLLEHVRDGIDAPPRGGAPRRARVGVFARLLCPRPDHVAGARRAVKAGMAP